MNVCGKEQASRSWLVYNICVQIMLAHHSAALSPHNPVAALEYTEIAENIFQLEASVEHVTETRVRYTQYRSYCLSALLFQRAHTIPLYFVLSVARSNAFMVQCIDFLQFWDIVLWAQERATNALDFYFYFGKNKSSVWGFVFIFCCCLMAALLAWWATLEML